MTASPDNYRIGKGIVSFRKTGDAEYRDLGNVPELEWSPEIEELEHFSSREGVRTRDKVVVLSKSATLRLVLEEWTFENLALAFLGEIDGDEIDVFSNNALTGALRYVGTNEVGPKFMLDCLNVSILPSGGGIGFISDEWGQLELNCEVGVDSTGSFGTLKLAPPLPANTEVPTISGTVQEGETLTATTGTWTGDPTFTYQWQEDIAGVWTNITGATAATLEVPGGATVGRTLRVGVTGTNVVGSATAFSAATVAVLAA